MALTHEEMAFPADRRLRLWIRPSALAVFAALAMAPVVVAWVQYAVAGLPPVSGPRDPAAAEGPHGFPLWLRAAPYSRIAESPHPSGVGVSKDGQVDQVDRIRCRGRAGRQGSRR